MTNERYGEKRRRHRRPCACRGHRGQQHGRRHDRRVL